VEQLRQSGELAVPILIDYLRDPAKAEYHDPIRSALRDMGRPVLNPLVAVTETKNQDLLIPVLDVLGELGYSGASPYIARVAALPDETPSSKAAAGQALRRMGASGVLSPADMFYDLGEKFYYDNADISADKRDPNAPANVWYWDETKGLIRKQVP